MLESFIKLNYYKVYNKPLISKNFSLKSKIRRKLIGFKCSDKLLINNYHTFENTEMIFTLKQHFTGESFNLAYAVNCGTSIKQNISEMRKENLN